MGEKAPKLALAIVEYVSAAIALQQAKRDGGSYPGNVAIAKRNRCAEDLGDAYAKMRDAIASLEE